MYRFLLFFACSSEPAAPSAKPAVSTPTATKQPPHPSRQASGNRFSPPQGGQHQHQPMGQPKGGSGGQFQDPSGFPAFHQWPAPPGPAINQQGDWSKPQQLTAKPAGGYRPQLAISPAGQLHVVFYSRLDAGDIIHHRRSQDGQVWTQAETFGHADNRNWGPDIVARDDESVVVVYDHALADFSSQGFVTIWKDGTWSSPKALTPGGKREVGSGHVANALGDDLVYVFIGKELGEKNRFRASYRWFSQGKWQNTGFLSAGKMDSWHTNVERRPDGSVLAGFDIGVGGSETTLYLADGRNGVFSAVENITENGKPGERPHFAFGADGRDHITWFHKENHRPIHIYVRSGKPGAWGPIEEPSAGYGGFHFDPEIAINKDGVLCLVWGWDAGKDAEMVYSMNRGQGWSKPKKIADINWGKPGLSSIDVDSSGHFHVVWNQGVRGYNEIYYAKLEVQ